MIKVIVFKKVRFSASCLIFGLFFLFLDFYSKFLIYEWGADFFGQYEKEIFSNFLGGINFTLHLTQNQGAAWGLFSKFPISLLLVRILAVITMLIYLCFFQPKKGEAIGFVLIVTGAIGNIIDFFLYGSVIDFFSFSFWGWHFAVFNLADVLVTVGIIWLGSYTLFFRRAPVA